MASIFKRKYNKIINGKKVKKQSLKYYTRLTDADGIKRTIPLFNDKTASQQKAGQLQKEFELAKAGVIDKFKEHRKKALTEHLADFEKSLTAKGNSEKHVLQTIQRVRTVIEGCKFTFWNDIQPSKVQNFIAGLRNGKNAISTATFNYYLKAVKQFCNWMIQDRRASESPINHLQCKKVKKLIDQKHARRVLELDKLRHLLETTKSAPESFGMTGYERYLLYRFTAETGLRANEIRSLKVSSFDFNNLTVKVSAEFTKNRQEAIQQLRPDTAKELKEFFIGKMPQSKVFGGVYSQLTDKTANMLKTDLKEAEIPYVENGQYFDFHSLRHQTGTLLAASGVHPKVAQSIMRHSDINLTMSRYTHTLLGQESEAINSLPDLSLPSKTAQKAIATGTDNKPMDAVQNVQKKLTPFLTPTTYSGCDQSAMIGNANSLKTKKGENCKSLKNGLLGAKKHPLSSSDNSGFTTRPKGLEPSTFGSTVR